ncbi:MAG: hypothetical protein KDE27_22625 [Planctomycetes bacterium]|nr:hypothetical protein [Planctomycetota bacterium]
MTYRPARRGLAFGIAAVLTRASTLAAVTLASSSDDKPAFDLGDASLILSIANPLGTILALAGVAYCAIAAHRRERSAALVIAWILNVVAALYIPELFIYFKF